MNEKNILQNRTRGDATKNTQGDGSPEKVLNNKNKKKSNVTTAADEETKDNQVIEEQPQPDGSGNGDVEMEQPQPKKKAPPKKKADAEDEDQVVPSGIPAGALRLSSVIVAQATDRTVADRTMKKLSDFVNRLDLAHLHTATR